MTDLTGCFPLVVDDKPRVALDITQCLQSEGASVQTAHCLAGGLRLAEPRDPSARRILRSGSGLARLANALAYNKTWRGWA
jgi:hypothetical protein